MASCPARAPTTDADCAWPENSGGFTAQGKYDDVAKACSIPVNFDLTRFAFRCGDQKTEEQKKDEGYACECRAYMDKTSPYQPGRFYWNSNTKQCRMFLDEPQKCGGNSAGTADHFNPCTGKCDAAKMQFSWKTVNPNVDPSPGPGPGPGPSPTLNPQLELLRPCLTNAAGMVRRDADARSALTEQQRKDLTGSASPDRWAAYQWAVALGDMSFDQSKCGGMAQDPSISAQASTRYQVAHSRAQQLQAIKAECGADDECYLRRIATVAVTPPRMTNSDASNAALTACFNAANKDLDVNNVVMSACLDKWKSDGVGAFSDCVLRTSADSLKRRADCLGDNLGNMHPSKKGLALELGHMAQRLRDAADSGLFVPSPAGFL